MKDTETALQNVIGTMAIEGFDLSDEDIERCRSIIDGSVNVDDVVAELVRQQTAIANVSNKKRDAG